MEFITTFKEGAIMLEVVMPNYNQPNDSSHNDSTNSSTMLWHVWTHVGFHIFYVTSFLSNITSPFITISEPLPFDPLELLFKFWKWKLGAFTKIKCKRSKIFKTKRMILHASCIWNWHNLQRKTMMLAWNDNWCNFTYLNKTKRCKLVVGPQPIINHKGCTTLEEKFHIVKKIE